MSLLSSGETLEPRPGSMHLLPASRDLWFPLVRTSPWPAFRQVAAMAALVFEVVSQATPVHLLEGTTGYCVRVSLLRPPARGGVPLNVGIVYPHPRSSPGLPIPEILADLRCRSTMAPILCTEFSCDTLLLIPILRGSGVPGCVYAASAPSPAIFLFFVAVC